MQDYSRQVRRRNQGGGDEEGGKVNEQFDLLGEVHIVRQRTRNRD